MHSLVHTATRDWLQKQEREWQASSDAIRHLAVRFSKKGDAHYDLRGEYLPHAIRLLSRNHEDKTAETYQLFQKAGEVFYTDRRSKEATGCFKEVYRWRQGHHPETDHDRLNSEHALASAYLNVCSPSRPPAVPVRCRGRQMALMTMYNKSITVADMFLSSSEA